MIARRVRALGARRLGAYAATWLIWGSTFLAIRLAVAEVPPFLLAGVRSVAAGSLLLGWAVASGQERPGSRQVKAALLTGVLFFLIGHGGLFWAEQRVASGPAALMIATEHFWMLMAGLAVGQVIASRRAWVGVAVGLAGVGLLTIGGSARGGLDPLGAGVLLVSSAAWGIGTLYFTGERKPRSQPWAAGLPLVGGGVLLLALSAASGELQGFAVERVSATALGALAYLVVFGSVVAFTAYSWLVEREGPSRALSFTYVNPLVAVLLGAAVAHEPLTARVAGAAAAIIAAVILIVGGTAAPAPVVDRSVRPGDAGDGRASPPVPSRDLAPRRRRAAREGRR